MALQIGHRLSVDLDFFSDRKDSLDDIEYELTSLPSASLKAKSNYALFYTIRGIKVDILNYPYPFQFDPVTDNACRLAAIEDVISMKLKTIMNRGSKKDFYDIFFLLKNYSFDLMVSLFAEKYKNTDPLSLYKSLCYFDDAEEDAEPVLLMEKHVTWQQIKKEIVYQTKTYFD